MSMLVGRELELDRDALKASRARRALPRHRKIGIRRDPAEAGPLTDEEFEIVKEHPELGERILAPIERLEDVRRSSARATSAGTGSAIPTASRAPTSPSRPRRARLRRLPRDGHDRPYRDRLPHEEAVRAARVRGHAVRPHDGSAFVRLYEAGEIFAGLISDLVFEPADRADVSKPRFSRIGSNTSH